MHGFAQTLPRTALVTGAGRRLGRAIAEALAEAGFAVAVHCNDSRTEAEAVVAAICARGGRAEVLAADLADEAAVQALLPAAAAALGPVGVLVNNASLFERDEWHDATRASWDRHMEPNLRAPFVLMQALANGLPAGMQGAVVNMLDQRVWSLTPHFVSYTVSKAALWALTRQMALALAPAIRVNAIGPGPALPSTRQTEAQFARQSASVPLGHGTSPDEVASAVLALLSLPSVTGQMLALDGGQHLQWSPAHGPGGEDVSGGVTMAGPGIRHVFLRDMVLLASIGVYPHEHGATQRIRINIDLAVPDQPGADRLDRVVDYERVADRVRSLVRDGHVKLVETLAERLAAACLDDPRVLTARVRVEKLDVFDDVASVGVEIERGR